MAVFAGGLLINSNIFRAYPAPFSVILCIFDTYNQVMCKLRIEPKN